MYLQQFIDIDREMLLFFNGSHSDVTDMLALVLTNAYTWIPLYVSMFWLVLKNNAKWSQILLVVGASALCVLLASVLSASIVKPAIARLRPSFEPSLWGEVQLVRGYTANGYSFFSSHAANTLSIAVFLSLVVRSQVFTRFMLLWSLVNCWTRLYLGVHYPSDILVGMCAGAVIGLVIYGIYIKLYMIVTDKLHYISSQYTRTGYAFSDIDVVLTVMALTFVYALIRAVVS